MFSHLHKNTNVSNIYKNCIYINRGHQFSLQATAATNAAPRPLPSSESIKSNWNKRKIIKCKYQHRNHNNQPKIILNLTLIPGIINCLIFSTIRSWKWGWKRYTEPSTPTVTLGSFILLIRTAIPADTKWAARLETHSQIYRTFAQSCSVACARPSSPSTSRQLRKLPRLSLKLRRAKS